VDFSGRRDVGREAPRECGRARIGTARDESGEIPERRGARIEQRSGLVGRVDAAGRDEIETIAESRARAADVVERRRENLGAGEAASALRQSRILHAARVAVVDDADARFQRSRDDVALVRVGEIWRDLDDERSRARRADFLEQRTELGGAARSTCRRGGYSATRC